MTTQNQAKAPLEWFRSDLWLGALIGRPAFQLDPNRGFFELSAPDRAAAIKKLSETPCFIFTKIPCQDVGKAAACTDLGFRVIDTNLVFEKGSVIGPKEANQDIQIRLARKSDADHVAALADAVFVFSRFHLDPKIERPVANTIKKEWAKNFFSGHRGDQMVVAEREGAIIGFLLLLKQDNGLTIDLIATDSSFRNLGIAGKMIDFAERFNPQADSLQVGTQAANIPSVRLYEKLGFRLVASYYVLHYHG